MGSSFPTSAGVPLVRDLIVVIQQNAQDLSDIDGQIGDGDHGVNMAKGFTLAGEQLTDGQDLASAFQALGNVLLNEIGGAMGPLYGSFFRAMARGTRGREAVDAAVFSTMLHGGLDKVRDTGGAAVGDKTLLDALAPAVAAFDHAIDGGLSFASALHAMKAAAKQGRDATKDIVAKKGRASRLGERSRGVLDAGAVSCCLLLCTMADSIGATLD